MVNKFFRLIFLSFLKRIANGSLTVYLPDGTSILYQGQNQGYDANINIKTWWVVIHAIARGNVGLAADYRDGFWTTENLEEFLLFGAYNPELIKHYGRSIFIFKMISRVLYSFRRNTVRQSKKNIHEHYDLGNDFYKVWLDKSMTYSSAIFTGQATTTDYSNNVELHQAQLQKYHYILNRMNTNNSSILEIGCGWGGFAEELCLRDRSVHYKGCTLSQPQAQYAIERNSQYNANTEIVIEDYRNLTGSYDYIVSIEMLEAVGQEYWSEYFHQIQMLLKPKGKAFIQTIIIDDNFFEAYTKQDDMIRTFIFPGGMLPCMSVLKKEFASCQLVCEEEFSFGQDYARTLRHWLCNFDQQYETIKALGFDDRFIRMWRFYLAFCIAGFISKRIDVVMLQLSKSSF